MSETRIRILHISDLHVRNEKNEPNGWRRRRVLGDNWNRNLDDLIRDEPLDLICFTGDLTHGGQREEYEQLGEFIEAVLARTHVTRERLFVVPGNHDIERRKEQDAWKALRSLGHYESNALSQWMAGGSGLRGIPDEYRDLILERQREYRNWLAKDLRRPELLPDPAKGHPRLGYRAELSGWPFPVHIIGLDSAWLAGDDSDHGKLQLTDEQVGRLTDGLTGFRLALVHHPLTDLADGTTCRRLLAERVGLLLRGHLHETELSLWSDPDRDLREIASGCLYESDRYPNACQRVDVTLDGNGKPLRYDLRFRAWSPRGFWYDDNSVYRNVVSGRYTWNTSPLAAANALVPGGSLPRP